MMRMIQDFLKKLGVVFLMFYVSVDILPRLHMSIGQALFVAAVVFCGWHVRRGYLADRREAAEAARVAKRDLTGAAD